MKTNKLYILSIVFFTVKGMLYLILGKYLVDNAQWNSWFVVPLLIIMISIVLYCFNKKSVQNTRNSSSLLND